MTDLRRRPDGSIDCDFYIQQSRARRAEAKHEVSSPAGSPQTKRHFKTFAAAFALATGLFWATMLSSPPVSQANSSSSSLSTSDLQQGAARSLPILEAHAH